MCCGGRPSASDRLGKAKKEMGQHHARVASGPQHGTAGRGLGGVAERGLAKRADGVGDGTKR